MNKKIVLSLLASSMISMSIMHAGDAQIDAEGFFSLPSFAVSGENLICAGLVGLFTPYMYKYWTKEDPQMRYDLDELKHGKNILKNVYYYFIDGFNGTPEVNESTKLKGENGKAVILEVKPKRSATGIVGRIHAAHRNIFTTAGFIAVIYAITHYKAVLKKLPALLKILKDSKDSLDIVATFIDGPKTS